MFRGRKFDLKFGIFFLHYPKREHYNAFEAFLFHRNGLINANKLKVCLVKKIVSFSTLYEFFIVSKKKLRIDQKDFANISDNKSIHSMLKECNVKYSLNINSLTTHLVANYNTGRFMSLFIQLNFIALS